MLNHLREKLAVRHTVVDKNYCYLGSIGNEKDLWFRESDIGGRWPVYFALQKLELDELLVAHEIDC